MKKYKIAVVGATGMVGRTFLKVLEEYALDADYALFASARSAGKELDFMNGHNSLKGFDGANISILRKGGKRFPLFFKNPSNICR